MGQSRTLFSCDLRQRGQTTSELRAILQKRDNLRATSNKMIHKTTNVRNLKRKRKDE